MPEWCDIRDECEISIVLPNLNQGGQRDGPAVSAASRAAPIRFRWPATAPAEVPCSAPVLRPARALPPGRPLRPAPAPCPSTGSRAASRARGRSWAASSGSRRVVFAVLVVGASLSEDATSREPVVTTLRDGASPTGKPTRDPQQRAPLNTSLKSNTVYSGGPAPRTRCRGGGADVFDHAQIKAHILKTAKCMDQAWKTALEKVGILFERPKWVIAAGKGRDRAGTSRSPTAPRPTTAPARCPSTPPPRPMANGNGEAVGYAQILGLARHLHGDDGPRVRPPRAAAHRSRAGALGEVTGVRVREPAARASSRRLELQANCFAGMFMRAVAPSLSRSGPTAQRPVRVLGQPSATSPAGRATTDPRRTTGCGSGEGWQKQRTHQCNTWAMPADAVS